MQENVSLFLSGSVLVNIDPGRILPEKLVDTKRNGRSFKKLPEFILGSSKV